ncbi:MAG: sodium pump decarboxylase [bacterium]|nr:sodium pump decarboxylase [bacterium]
MLMQGVIFMVVGMTMVFLFLIIMVIIMKFMAVLLRFCPEAVKETVASPPSLANGLEEVAVAIAACQKY